MNIINYLGETMSTSLQSMNQRLIFENYSAKFREAFAQALTTKELKLDEMHITSSELIEDLLPFLNRYSSIHTLNVSHNQINEAGARALAANQTLKTLRVNGNQIGDAGAIALADNQSLRTLDVSYNQIGDAGAIALADNQSLETLEIRYNQIGDAGARALAANQSLRTLDVNNNQIGDAGAIALADNQSLETLDITANKIEDAGRQTLQYAFQSRINQFIKEKAAFLSVMTKTHSPAINFQVQDELNAKKQLTTLFKMREGIRDKSNKITNRLDNDSIKNIFSYLKAKPFTVKL
ncbi:MAG: hypothetical protein JWM09_719 [Francisellaceae bacterium]|nr:hypothetical protein [Francisellaceae bacterium]